MICNPGEIVVVPFPFTDRAAMKRRPALVLSSHSYNLHTGHSIMAMITSAKSSSWHLDISFDWAAAGLPGPCIVRMKIATLDNRIILRKAGKLLPADWARVRQNVQNTLG